MVFRSFAVIGAGHLGSFIIDELLRLKVIGTVSSVAVLSRSDITASHPEWATQGAKFVAVDYNDRSSLVTAFEGVEVVICTVRGVPEAIQGQEGLADAAKAAGAKIFVPSEFGTASANHLVEMKTKILNYLKEIELPYVIFYTGPWVDLIMIPFFGFDLVNGKVNVPGIGDTPISFTGRPDVARYVAFVFTNLPVEKLEWKTFRMEGERSTWNKLLREYQEKTGKTLEITHTPPSELESRSDHISVLTLRWERGEGVVGDQIDNDVYPGWNPKKAVENLV